MADREDIYDDGDKAAKERDDSLAFDAAFKGAFAGVEESHQPAPGREQERILQFFKYEHLPEHLQDVSRPFSLQAALIMQLPRNPERTVALRKLLESKDAAVRAALAE